MENKFNKSDLAIVEAAVLVSDKINVVVKSGLSRVEQIVVNATVNVFNQGLLSRESASAILSNLRVSVSQLQESGLAI